MEKGPRLFAVCRDEAETGRERDHRGGSWISHKICAKAREAHRVFESDADNTYLPHNYTSNAVVYTGTHDNDTTRGWYIASDEKQLEFINKYADIRCSQTATWDLIRLAMQSVADTAIIPIQDYLDIGSDGRINTPSTLGGNWSWRLLPEELTDDLAARMKEFAQIYGRISK